MGPCPVYAQDFYLPAPGVRVSLSPQYNPPILKGIKVHPDNPFKFDFILDQGDSKSMSSPNALVGDLKQESTKLIKYFLASLTIPEKDLWVNLSPYEKNRVVPESFGQTEMGRDLLAEDYMLKQITASLIYPEGEVGKKFWKRIYEEAQKKFGTTNIPVNTFNKVWIIPEKAVVYENAKAGTAYVVESKLKVMLEEDYLSLQKHSPSLVKEGVRGSSDDVNAVGSQIIREIVIPELTQEVNEGKNFTQLRQVYNSLILATWYKKKIKDSILEQVYAGKNKIAGVNIDDPKEKEKIYQQYLQAFKKGVYNYIKEDADPVTKQSVPRKYFSGGVNFFGDLTMLTTDDPAMLPLKISKNEIIETNLRPADMAMPVKTGKNEVMQTTDAQMRIDLRGADLTKEDATFIERIFRSTKLIEYTFKTVHQVSVKSNEIESVKLQLYSQEGDNRIVYKVDVLVFGQKYNFIMKITRFDDQAAMDHVVMTALTNQKLNRPDGFIAKMPDGRLITTGPYFPGINARSALSGEYTYRVLMSVAEESSRIWFALDKHFIYEPHGGQFVVDRGFYTFGATLVDRGHFRISSSLDTRLIADDPQDTLRVEAHADSADLDSWIVQMPDDHFIFTLMDHLLLEEGIRQGHRLNMYAIAEGIRSGLGAENARDFLRTIKASTYRQEDPLRKAFIQAAEFVFTLPAEIGPSVFTPFPLSLKGFNLLPSESAESRSLTLLALEQFDTNGEISLNDLILNLFREINDPELQEAVIKAIVHILLRGGKIIDEAKIEKIMKNQWYSFIPIPLSKIIDQILQVLLTEEYQVVKPGKAGRDKAMHAKDSAVRKRVKADINEGFFESAHMDYGLEKEYKKAGMEGYIFMDSGNSEAFFDAWYNEKTDVVFNSKGKYLLIPDQWFILGHALRKGASFHVLEFGNVSKVFIFEDEKPFTGIEPVDPAMSISRNRVTKEFEDAKAIGNNWISRPVDSDGRIVIGNYRFSIGRSSEGATFRLYKLKSDWEQGLRVFHIIEEKEERSGTFYPLLDEYRLTKIYRQADDHGSITVKRLGYKSKIIYIGIKYGNQQIILRPYGEDWENGCRIYLGEKQIGVYIAAKDMFSLLERQARTDDKGRFGYKKIRYSLGSVYANTDLVLKPYEDFNWEKGIRVFEGDVEIASYAFKKTGDSAQLAKHTSSADEAMNAAMPVSHHQYVEVMQNSDEYKSVYQSLIAAIAQSHRDYFSRFIDGAKTSSPLHNATMSIPIDEFPTMSGVYHQGLVKDEMGVYWIVKKREYVKLRNDFKNVGRRERFAYLLTRGKVNFVEIRYMTPQEAAGMPFITGSIYDYYLTRVVVPSKREQLFLEKDIAQAFSDLFVAYVLLRKFDQHLGNLAFLQGVPVSVDNDLIGPNQVIANDDSKNHKFNSRFILSSVYQTAMAVLSDQNVKDQLKRYELIRSVGEIAVVNYFKQLIRGYGLGWGFIRANMLDKELLKKSILRLKSINNIEHLALQAGYKGHDLEMMAGFIKRNQRNLGRDVNDLWGILTGEDGGFNSLDMITLPDGSEAPATKKQGRKIGKIGDNAQLALAEKTKSDGAMKTESDVIGMDFKDALDHAMNAHQRNTGGIDLTPANMNLQTKVMDSREQLRVSVNTTLRGNDMEGNGNGAEVGIKFHLDAAMLEQLRNAPGFVPVIISISPLTDLKAFLGAA
jgi:hypothetical protein